MDDLLYLVNSDGADGLKLRVGDSPVILMDGEPHPVEGPPVTVENLEQFLHSLTTTRQRRDLREHGLVQFIFRFRGSTDFVICAKMEEGNVAIDVH